MMVTFISHKKAAQLMTTVDANDLYAYIDQCDGLVNTVTVGTVLKGYVIEFQSEEGYTQFILSHGEYLK